MQEDGEHVLLHWLVSSVNRFGSLMDRLSVSKPLDIA